jgi:phosphoglucosamine mutase
MARKYFGTDGIRGEVNSPKMNSEIAMRIGMAAGRYFRRGDHIHRVVIGKDTRRSGYMLEPALTSGFTAMGMEVITTGPLPTPAVAMLTKSMRADLGVMISASHNPYKDNGIKLFGPDGYKLSDEVESEIETMMDNGLNDHLSTPETTGSAVRLDDVQGRYVEFAKATIPQGFDLQGLKVVIDCANGAAYKVAPPIFWELGAELITIGVSPNGFNINENCGSTCPEPLSKEVLKQGADIGIALDGDADRLIVVDEKGNCVDGDQLMAVIVKAMNDRGKLKGGGLVSTVMSNLGLEYYLKSLDLKLERTKVGDRYVVEHMRKHGFNVGGEQSGHIVMSDYATTGDGLIAALQILTVLKKSGKPASEILNVFEPLPQFLKSVHYNTDDALEDAQVKACILEAEAQLNGSGRLLIRKSGTEPVVRVMAEGEDQQLIEKIVSEICTHVENAA